MSSLKVVTIDLEGIRYTTRPLLDHCLHAEVADEIEVVSHYWLSDELGVGPEGEDPFEDMLHSGLSWPENVAFTATTIQVQYTDFLTDHIHPATLSHLNRTCGMGPVIEYAVALYTRVLHASICAVKSLDPYRPLRYPIHTEWNLIDFQNGVFGYLEEGRSNAPRLI